MTVGGQGAVAGPELAILLVNWKSADYIRACLRSLAADAARPVVEVVVVDNDPDPACRSMLAAEFPYVIYRAAGGNLGFGRACNLAASISLAPVLLFLNPDTELLPGALRSLLAAVERMPKAGVVGARLINSDGSLQTSCVQAFPSVLNQVLDLELFRRISPRSRLWGMRPLFEEGALPRPAEVISGACLLVKRSVFGEAGGFSPEFFMYAEDADLCRKVASRGYVNYHVPDARIVHHGDGSVRAARTNFACVMAVESMRRFIAKHHGRVRAILFRLLLGVSATARLAVLGLAHAMFRRRMEEARAKWMSVLRWSVGRERWVMGYP